MNASQAKDETAFAFASVSAGGPATFPAVAQDQLMYLVGAIHDGQCRCVIELDGRVDGERMARAVELSLVADPILSSRYVARQWRSRWERCSLPVPFTEVQARETKGEIETFLAAPMGALRGPQVEVLLVRGEPDTLCVKVTHQVADATGLLDYIRLLSGIYLNLKKAPEYQPEAGWAADRGQGQVLRGAGWRAVLKGCLRFSFPRSPWGFPKDGADLSGRSFPVRHLERERVERLKSYCKAKQVKFTDVVTAAYYRALTRTLHPPAGAVLPFQLTIDLRRYLSPGRRKAICDLASAYFLVIGHNPEESFEETLKKIEAAVDRAKRSHSWLAAAVFLEITTKLPLWLQKQLAHRMMQRELSAGHGHPVLSNLGVVDPGIFDFGDAVAADVELLGPVAFPPNFVVSLYSFRERLHINTAFCQTAVDARRVEEFFAHFIEGLPT